MKKMMVFTILAFQITWLSAQLTVQPHSLFLENNGAVRWIHIANDGALKIGALLSTQMTLNYNSGFLGIGIDDPLTALHVKGNARLEANNASLEFYKAGGSMFGQIKGSSNDIVFENVINTNGRILFDADRGFEFRKNNNNQSLMKIDGANGLVTIGNGAHTPRLHVYGNIKLEPQNFSGPNNSGYLQTYISGFGPVFAPNQHEWGFLGRPDNAFFEVYSFNFLAHHPTDGYLGYSDKRIKENIKPVESTTKQLMKLKPVFYDLKKEFYYKSNSNPYKTENRRKNNCGFIAQNLEKIYPHLVVDNKESGLKAISVVGLIPPLVKGFQEQQETILTLRKQIQQQEERTQKLQKELESLKKIVHEFAKHKSSKNKAESNYILPLHQKAFIQQNQPNPFHQETNVEYFLPETTKSASLQVTSLDGKVLGSVPITQAGKGQVTIKASAYPAGTYFYSLIVDGQVLETKRMVLTR